MPVEHAQDVSVAAVVLAIFAGLWFTWSVRHVRGLWVLVPVAGMISAVVVGFRGTVDAIGAWGTGTSAEGGTIGLYLVALALQGAVTRLITGFLSRRNLAHLVPTTVAVSLVGHLVVLAELLRVNDLYYVALACLAATILAWPIAAVGRFMTPGGTPITHATTGLLLASVLLAGAAQSLT